MSYNAQRVRNMYVTGQEKPFKISRSKIDLFRECPRCFYLDRKLGVSPPDGPPFTINIAVDTLLKKEFDACREAGVAHPLMIENKINAVPYRHEKLNDWRNALHKGQQHLHVKTNLLLTGAIDDLWITPEREIIIVDYKATSKKSEVSIDADWQITYRRQMDIYAWLFAQEGFKVHKTAYFVYANASTEKENFDNELQFKTVLLPYQVDTSWVEAAVVQLKATLEADEIPKPSPACDQCKYNEVISKLLSPKAPSGGIAA